MKPNDEMFPEGSVPYYESDDLQMSEYHGLAPVQHITGVDDDLPRHSQWPLVESELDCIGGASAAIPAPTIGAACTSASLPISGEKDYSHKLMVHQEADIGIRIMQRDLHEDRMKKLRQLAKQLDQDDWMFPHVDGT